MAGDGHAGRDAGRDAGTDAGRNAGRDAGREFLPMPRGERRALAFLLVFSAASFLPAWRHLEVLGVAVSGWMMAILMLISPLLTLWVFGSAGRRR